MILSSIPLKKLSHSKAMVKVFQWNNAKNMRLKWSILNRVSYTHVIDKTYATLSSDVGKYGKVFCIL